jgi:hypothetical protein
VDRVTSPVVPVVILLLLQLVNLSFGVCNFAQCSRAGKYTMDLDVHPRKMVGKGMPVCFASCIGLILVMEEHQGPKLEGKLVRP